MTTPLENVSAAVQALRAEHPTRGEILRAIRALAVQVCDHLDIPTTPRGARPWQVTLRFWSMDEAGPSLIAETEPEMIEGTGALLPLVQRYATELHGFLPADIGISVKQMQSLRVGLSQNDTAVMRIAYKVEDVSYRCQCDVERV